MVTYSFSFSFNESIAIEIALRKSLSRLWEFYCSSKRNHAPSIFLDSVRLDIEDTISALRKISNN